MGVHILRYYFTASQSARRRIGLQPILCKGIAKQQAGLAALFYFPSSEVDHVHMPAEAHRHRSAMPPAHATVIVGIRTITGVIVGVGSEGRALVGFPHEISRGIKRS